MSWRIVDIANSNFFLGNEKFDKIHFAAGAEVSHHLFDSLCGSFDDEEFEAFVFFQVAMYLGGGDIFVVVFDVGYCVFGIL